MALLRGRPMLEYLYDQLAGCRHRIAPVLATTDRPQDDPLAAFAESKGWPVFRGSETDVLGRYHAAAEAFGADPETVIVRHTGDGILPDPNLFDAALDLHAAFAGQVEAVFIGGDTALLPYGVFVESYRFRALDRAHREATDAYDREHVSPYIKRNPELFPCINVQPSRRLDGPSLPIDYPEDRDRIETLLGLLAAQGHPPYSTGEILRAWNSQNQGGENE